MKVNKIVTDVDNGQCYVAEVVFGSGDKINGVKLMTYFNSLSH